VTRNLLPRAFFLPPPDVVAQSLLGKLLLRRLPGGWLAGRIVETEAYFGSNDAAAHAAAGQTARNAVLWGAPGHAYVYFIYGMHNCLNVSCEPPGTAGCVLVRALEPLEGLAEMAALRGLVAGDSTRLLTSGPGRLCQAFGIARAEMNGVDLLDPASDLQLADDGSQPGAIEVTARIGISKAGHCVLWLLETHVCRGGAC
jgi:DNA-3-methyladenine glycosylase